MKCVGRWIQSGTFWKSEKRGVTGEVRYLRKRGMKETVSDGHDFDAL